MLSKLATHPRTYLILSVGGCLTLCAAAVTLVFLAQSTYPVRIQQATTPISTASAAGTSAAPAPAPAPAPVAPVAFEQALAKAVNDLFSKANLDGAPAKVRVVIDPLIDGISGAQSAATRTMELRINDIVKSSYKRFEVTPFTTEAVAGQPVVLVGTFTAINNAGLASGPRDAYRICLALADLKSKKIISKAVARALPAGHRHHADSVLHASPAFIKDEATDAYIKTCQGTPLGQPVASAYADRMQVSVLVNDAIRAYDARTTRRRWRTTSRRCAPPAATSFAC